MIFAVFSIWNSVKEILLKLEQKRCIIDFIVLMIQDVAAALYYHVQVEFHVPAKITVCSPHHGLVCAASHLTDGALVTCSEV